MRRAFMAAAAAALVAACAVLSPGVGEGPRLRLLQLVTLVPAALLVSMAAAPLVRGGLAARLAAMLDRPGDRVFAAAAMLWILGAALWLALVPLDGIPKGGDETAYLFQARIFARGEAWAPQPPVEDPRRFFPFRHFIFDGGRWFTMYMPLHALLMSPFAATGTHSLMGPVQGALSVLGAYLLFRQWMSRRRARVAVLLMCLSPFVLFMAASRMAHNTTMLLAVWSLYLLTRACRTGRRLQAALSGLLMGLAVAAKPWPDIAWWMILPLILLFSRSGRRMLPWLVAGALPAAALLIGGNILYTGDPFRTPYDMARGGSLIGFGPGKAWYPVYGDNAHTPARGLMNLAQQAGTGSVILLGWPLISLVPSMLGLAGAIRDRRRLWLAGTILLYAVLLSMHYSPSVDYGPRHWYTLVPVGAALGAAGLGTAARRAGRLRVRGGEDLAAGMVLALFAITAAVYMPAAVRARSGTWQAIDDEVMVLAREGATPPAVVFMQASEHGWPNIVSGMNHLSPFLDGPYIFCAHQTAREDAEFMERVAGGRNAYIYHVDGGSGVLEPWSEELASRLTPARDLLPEPSVPRRGSPDGS